MSDEMVQEPTSEPTTQEEQALAPESGAAGTPVSSAADAPAPATEPAHDPTAASAAEEIPAPSAQPRAAGGGAEDSFEAAMQKLDLDSQYDRSFRQLREGDVIAGTVMRVDREGVLVDVGAKSEGIIRLNELSRDPGANANPESIVSVGERIKVYVLEPENQDGNPILSKKRADFEQAWDKVQQARESGETITAMVTDRVKGGLVVDLGIRGFVPASHVGNGSLKNNLDKYVGQSIPLKVIEVDKDRRKVVLSNKLAVAEEREAKSAETKSSLTPGQIRHGVVRRLTNYGAFVDLGGIDGLLHISEMSWTRINDPKEVLREGQELDVLILKMDLENNRVSLGLRQILPDPWNEIGEKYKEGDVITGSVTRTVPFGAFVQVAGGVEGIIPNVEMPRGRGGKGGPPIAVGDEVEVKVLSVRPEERKMTLSMRALQPVEEREPAPREAPAAGPPREQPAREAGSGGGKRARGDRERDDRDDYTRYAPGRNEEPRFTIGDAIAAQRRDRPRRERRTEVDEYEDLTDLEDLTEAEEPAETEE
jgi:predicted RNA-binding protein with RPS1 domain